MKVDLDFNDLIKDLKGLSNYSIGFLDGVEAAKPVILDNIGKEAVESLKNFIDSNARVDPQTLHHVYEWYQTGSPQARLFDIDYIVYGKNGLSFDYTFSQSTSYSKESTVPFYNKAEVIENGIPVVIRPKTSSVISFESDGEQIFTKKPVVVNNPGGSDAEGGFEKTIKSFFDSYFTQSFLMSSGILSNFENPSAYKRNVAMGAKQGKSMGFRVGYEWATKGGKIE